MHHEQQRLAETQQERRNDSKIRNAAECLSRSFRKLPYTPNFIHPYPPPLKIPFQGWGVFFQERRRMKFLPRGASKYTPPPTPNWFGSHTTRITENNSNILKFGSVILLCVMACLSRFVLIGLHGLNFQRRA